MIIKIMIMTKNTSLDEEMGTGGSRIPIRMAEKANSQFLLKIQSLKKAALYEC